MRFVLVYKGPLPSTGNNAEKHNIRKAIHPQLARLWQIEPALLGLANSVEQVNNARVSGLDKISSTHTRRGFRFVPLVTKPLNLVCYLEVTFLRREAPGELVRRGGDIDNRIKILFDSLRVPDEAQVENIEPGEGENPFYCLLGDDSLITGFQVKTERLLESPPTRQQEADVHLTVTAIVRPTVVTIETISFLGGWL
jgi:hypothetical protein